MVGIATTMPLPPRKRYTLVECKYFGQLIQPFFTKEAIFSHFPGNM